jgi:hypothetical protein
MKDNPNWNTDQDNALYDFRRAGKAFNEIARILNKDGNSCARRYEIVKARKNNWILQSDSELRGAVIYLQQRGNIVYPKNGVFLFNGRFQMTPTELLKKAKRVRENTRLAV